MVNIATLSTSKYLKRTDLQGRNRAVTIANAVVEHMENDNSQKLVLYFQGIEKGLVCNVTNLQTIAEELGSEETDHWTGRQITLTTQVAEFNGKKGPAIRVMNKWDRQGNHQPVDAQEFANQPDTSPFANVAQQQSNASQAPIENGPMGYNDDPGVGNPV